MKLFLSFLFVTVFFSVSAQTLPAPAAGDYGCIVSYHAFSQQLGMMMLNYQPSLLGTLTLDGEGTYTVNDQQGNYVYGASGFTFTTGPMQGWPALYETFGKGVELRLSATGEKAVGAELRVGEILCQLEAEGVATGAGSSSDTGGDATTDRVANTTTATAPNGDFTGTLTFDEVNGSNTIVDVDLATGKVTPRFSGSDPNRAADGETVFVNGQGALVIVDPKGVTLTTLPADPNDEPSQPIFSPDGSLIAYTAMPVYYDSSVIVLNRDGSQVASFDNMVSPNWTPDGRLVTAANLGYEGAEPGLFISDAGLTTLTRFDPNLDDVDLPAVSPDGNTVAFSFHNQIWLMGLDGSDPRQLTFMDNGIDSFSWSPDGSALVVIGGDYDEVFLVTLDGAVSNLLGDGETMQANGRATWR